MKITRSVFTGAIRAPRARRAARAALEARLLTLLHALSSGTPPARSLDGLLAQVADAVGVGSADHVWLTLSVLTARLPVAAEVVELRRLGELSGAAALLAEAVRRMPPETLGRPVEVATGAVLVDVNHLADTTLMTGVQRVTNQVVSRWSRDHPVTFVRWTDEFRALRRTTADETARAVEGPTAATVRPSHDARGAAVIVPWRSHVVLPEVALEVPRTRRLLALARHSRCATGAIGFDTVPLTSAETTERNVPGYFMQELAAIRQMGRVATISAAARTEYEGWRAMGAGAGLGGPELRAILLPVEATEPSTEQLDGALRRYCTPDLPLVLCVGSHEPRKNHLAVLHAAELLWREGVTFSLLFVGGNAWQSERFEARVEELRATGRRVGTAVGVRDEALWALYRLARCTVFPSLNEGFGLPVAESLASGTPVVTSGFGSMKEIAATGGALLVDPRDDHAIADALRSLLTDDGLHARLTREAAELPARTWESYANETWDYLVARQPVPGVARGTLRALE
jgi:glycosyltransferase involved in cell wall biosynthesis